jgi:hypothetical protein
LFAGSDKQREQRQAAMNGMSLKGYMVIEKTDAFAPTKKT